MIGGVSTGGGRVTRVDIAEAPSILAPPTGRAPLNFAAPPTEMTGEATFPELGVEKPHPSPKPGPGGALLPPPLSFELPGIFLEFVHHCSQ